MSVLALPDVRAVVARHFSDLGDDVVDTETAICCAESGVWDYTQSPPVFLGCRVEAQFDNYPWPQPDPNSIYRYDRGLAEINSVWGFDAAKLLADPDYNLGAARFVYDRQGFGAWATYWGGEYLVYLPLVQSAHPAPPAPVPWEDDVQVDHQVGLDRAAVLAAALEQLAASGQGQAYRVRDDPADPNACYYLVKMSRAEVAAAFTDGQIP